MTAPEQSADVELVARTALATVLEAHYLANIVCDHDRKMDNPWCGCAMVDLGWHPTVGDAVRAWVQHVLAAADPVLAALGARLLPSGGETVVEWAYRDFDGDLQACICGSPELHPARQSRTVTTWSDGPIRRVEGEWEAVGDGE